MNWQENDELAHKLILLGNDMEDYVAAEFIKHGLKIRQPKHSPEGNPAARDYAHSWEEWSAARGGAKKEVRRDHENSEDMLIAVASGEVLAEIKSRNVSRGWNKWFRLGFTSPEDFPHDTIFVDTVSGFDAKERKPDVVICVCQHTKTMIWLPVKQTRKFWTQMQRWDATREITDNFYECPKGYWKPIKSLVDTLKTLQ